MPPPACRREIHLNGWTLVLCERGAPPAPSPAPVPAPAPAPVPAPAPAPPVSGFNGPPNDSASTGSGATTPGAGTGATRPPASSILGWQVVYKGAGAGAGASGAAPAPEGAPVPPPSLQQLAGQGPILTYIEQQLTALASGLGEGMWVGCSDRWTGFPCRVPCIDRRRPGPPDVASPASAPSPPRAAAGGVCDAQCMETKQKMWRAGALGACAGAWGMDGFPAAATIRLMARACTTVHGLALTHPFVLPPTTRPSSCCLQPSLACTCTLPSACTARCTAGSTRPGPKSTCRRCRTS